MLGDINYEEKIGNFDKIRKIYNPRNVIQFIKVWVSCTEVISRI